MLMLLCMQLKPVGIGRLFELNADVESIDCSVPVSQNAADNSMVTLLSKLISGQLIYPWVEPPSQH